MQQRNEKVTDPSMEDILASIRKIISEDAAPTQSDAGERALTAPPATTGKAAATVTQPAPQPAAPKAEATKPAAEAARPVAAGSAAVSASPLAAGTRLSDFVRELAPSAVPVNAFSSATFHDDLADLVEGDAEPPAASPPRRTETPAPAPAKAAPAAMSPKPAEAAAAPRAPTPRSADLGAFIPSTAESLGMSGPRPMPLPIGVDLRALDLGKPGKDKDQPALPPVEPVVPVAVAKPVAQAAVSAAQSEPPTSLESVADPVAAAQSALGALAMGLASPASKPAAMVAASARSVLDQQSAGAIERKTLDDTIVDMLRPMISDWLDGNLPEMVEKALRQELAERGKSSR